MNKSLVFILCVITMMAVVEAKPSPCHSYGCGGDSGGYGGGNEGGYGGGCASGNCGSTINNIGNGRNNRNTVYMRG